MIIDEKYKPTNERYEKALAKYREFLGKIDVRAEQVNEFVRWLENKTSWLWSPASSRFHLNIPGGLLIHSVGVTETLLKIRDTLAPQYSDESCIIVALFHDAGKIGEENIPYYIPDPHYRGDDIKYVSNPEITAMGIGVRSLYIVSRFISLSAEEAQSICYHDGQYIPENRPVALKEKPLLLMLHYADLWTASVLE
ncbi:phosphohydrolase [bacterium]|nr:phosphohydrolase [bacterium]